MIDHMQILGSLSLGSRTKRLSDLLMQQVDAIYQQQGIALNPSYFPLFTLINNEGPVSVTQAAQRLSVSHPAISKMTQKMIKEGLLHKQPHPSDQRVTVVAFTEKSLKISQQAQPIWQQIQWQLEQIMQQQQHPLLAAIDEFEQLLAQQSLTERVVTQLPAPQDAITIEPWQTEYKHDFTELNLAWLNQYFNGELTAIDQQALYHPEQYYLASGGYIFFARQGHRIVGTLALRLHDQQTMEISKMAVQPNQQGKGIGRQLMLTAINKAQQLAMTQVFLETNSALTRAMALYQHLGFQVVPHPQGQSSYPRADRYMTLALNTSSKD
ncbi:bifunctional helix-turn-helix transcriptional regulator/GNAT family N-acetyltransferase [Motilimonas sp. E26]|uniref:bifunctional helix-turn-helix transcriptional regulator/GNAT family N-acetyltransferase n=1 Tax=Motilimonas sp. E26 TaxID=2865674 RepID=UPI001E5D3585|nr:bifunctional helix-turn-helix transcriptional regulator/GNAT family N-acetyltransferase [Motilimonas sp. E26]MCE0557713.1 bifunctional helix-turn-helix transcriptional regulator/GNAT family N-acetyltransferase [Motilimonas sp. E26]